MHTIALKEGNLETGSFLIEPGRLSRAIRVRPGVVSITPRVDAGRDAVAQFIENTYDRHFGARITVDYPNLISLRLDDGDIVAAAGFRFASAGSLFLEHYLGAPVESVLDAPRADIVEIGNLASGGSGASVFLFMALASYLDTVRARRAVITCTASLENRLSRLGLEPRTVCAADPARVAGDGNAWGTYYESNPRVVVGDIPLACSRLRTLFGKDFFRHRPRLFPRLHYDTAKS